MTIIKSTAKRICAAVAVLFILCSVCLSASASNDFQMVFPEGFSEINTGVYGGYVSINDSDEYIVCGIKRTYTVNDPFSDEYLGNLKQIIMDSSAGTFDNFVKLPSVMITEDNKYKCIRSAYTVYKDGKKVGFSEFRFYGDNDAFIIEFVSDEPLFVVSGIDVNIVNSVKLFSDIYVQTDDVSGTKDEVYHINDLENEEVTLSSDEKWDNATNRVLSAGLRGAIVGGLSSLIVSLVARFMFKKALKQSLEPVPGPDTVEYKGKYYSIQKYSLARCYQWKNVNAKKLKKMIDKKNAKIRNNLDYLEVQAMIAAYNSKISG